MASVDDVLAEFNAFQGPSEDAEDTISRAQGEVQTRAQNAAQSLPGDLQAILDAGSSTAPQQSTVQGGAGSAFMAAYGKTTGPVQELTDYIVSNAPALGTRFTTDGILSADDQYGEGFSEADPQVRREMILEARAQAVAEEYGDVGDHPVAEFLGMMAGELADPTSLAPFGRGIAGAVKGGAAMGALSGVTEGLAEEGAVDAEQVVTMAAIGAALGGVLEAAVVQPLGKLISKYKSSGIKPDADTLRVDLEKAIPEDVHQRMDFDVLAQELEAYKGLGDYSPEVTKVVKEFNAKDLSGRKTELGVEYAEASDFEFKSAMSDKWDKGELGTKLTTYKGSEVVGAHEWNFPDWNDYRVLTEKAKKVDPNMATVEGQLIKGIGDYKQGKRTKPSVTQEPKGRPSKVREQRQIRMGINDEFLDRNLADKMAEKQETYNLLNKAIPRGSYTWQKIKNDSLAVQGSAMHYRPTAEPGDEMYHIIANQHVPWTSETGKKIRPPIGEKWKDDPFPEESWNTTSGSVSRFIDGMLAPVFPERRLSGMKEPIGKIASKYLRDAHVNTNWKIGDSVNTYKMNRHKLGIKVDSQEELLAVEVLRRVRDPKDVPSNVRQLAESVQKQLNSAYREARDIGVISDKEYQSAVKRGIEKGYLPRVTDMDKLRTSAGRDEFIKRLSTKAMSYESAEAIVKAIARSDKKADMYLTQINKKGDQAFINTSIARKLWEDYNVVSPTYRSKHLEAPRMLPEQWEDIMSPFLVNNLEPIMASWSQDVFTRLEYAKVFGAKDENAIKITKRLGEIDTGKADDFHQLFHTAVGSPESAVVKSFIDKPLKTRRLVAGAKAFQTLKLTLASIANATQGPLNGLYYAMSKTEVPTPKALNMWAKSGLKAVRASFGGEEARFTYDKFGAATQTMLLDAMGGINESMHTVTGRKFQFGLLEFFNNPSVMLRKVGYFHVEEFSRRYGQFLGEAMVEDTLERKMRLLAKGNRADPKMLKKVNDTLIELGLDPTADPSKLSVKDVGLAGQRVANILNFTNDPQTSPLIMQSFWGKFATQFKSYIFKQTDFIAKRIIEPAAKDGNLRPLMAALAVGTPVGMGIDEFRRFILGDDKDLSMTERLLRSHMMIGSMGALADIVNQSAKTPGGFASWLAGPTIGDVGKVINAGVRSVDQGSPAPMAKAAAGLLVYPGRTAVVDSISKEKEGFDSLFESKFGGSEFNTFKK